LTLATTTRRPWCKPYLARISENGQSLSFIYFNNVFPFFALCKLNFLAIKIIGKDNYALTQTYNRSDFFDFLPTAQTKQIKMDTFDVRNWSGR
jgi:hypothetical protein